MQKKKIVLFTLIILLCLIIGFIMLNNKPKNPSGIIDNSTQNSITNENVLNTIIIPGEKTTQNFKFTDIKFEPINAEEYEFLATIENTGTEIIDSTNLDIKLFNSNNEIICVVGAITKPLMPSEKGILKTYILEDIKDTKDAEFTISD